MAIGAYDLQPVQWLRSQRSCTHAQELDAAGILASEQNPDPALPSADTLRRMPVLNAVVHESLRCFPPVPAAIGRCLPHNVTVKGRTLPKGAIVGNAIWATHFSTEFWGPDAGEWRPARWLEARSIASAKKDEAGFTRWLPFAIGPQSCIAQHLALVRPGYQCHTVCVFARCTRSRSEMHASHNLIDKWQGLGFNVKVEAQHMGARTARTTSASTLRLAPAQQPQKRVDADGAAPDCGCARRPHAHRAVRGAHGRAHAGGPHGRRALQAHAGLRRRRARAHDAACTGQA